MVTTPPQPPPPSQPPQSPGGQYGHRPQPDPGWGGHPGRAGTSPVAPQPAAASPQTASPAPRADTARTADTSASTEGGHPPAQRAELSGRQAAEHSTHGHVHDHGPAAPASRNLRKLIAAVLIPFAAAVAVGMVVLWPDDISGRTDGSSGVGFDQPTFDARVTAVREVDCADVNVQPQQPSGQQQSGPNAPGGQPAGGGSNSGGSNSGGPSSGGANGKGCHKATVEVTNGKDKGHTFTEVVTPDATRTYSTGQQVVVAYAEEAPPKLRYSVIDVDRTMPMLLLAGIFAVVVVLVGRWRGILALIGLAISFAVLTLFILPAILDGSNPLLVAVVGGSAIMLATLYLCHGLSARTSVAALGTLSSLLLIGLLGSAFIDWGALTGNTDDQTGLVHGLFPEIEVQGLLLAGVLIGSLGVLDDVTVTQTSAVWELKQADPSASRRGLYGAAMRIGRDHIASVVNTLVLAYAGAALPLLLLFTIADSSVGTIAGSELVAQEIVRTLVGSIGLVASVPLTTLLAALVVSADRQWSHPTQPRSSRATDRSGDKGSRGRGQAATSGRGRRRKPR